MTNKSDPSSTKTTHAMDTTDLPASKLTSYKEDIDNLFTFQFHIFNPVRWFIYYLDKREFAPTQFLNGKFAERYIWVSKSTPTPVVNIPAPALTLATRRRGEIPRNHEDSMLVKSDLTNIM